MSKKLDPEEKARRKKERDHAYYVRHYDEQKARYRTNGEIWRREHPERVREIDRKARATLRQTVIAAYGGKCACCGIDDWHFLSIDHINNDGAKHRMETRFGSNQLWQNIALLEVNNVNIKRAQRLELVKRIYVDKN